MKDEPRRVDVALGERSYPIIIGRGLLDDGELLREHIPAHEVMVVSNDTVAPLYLDRLASAFGTRRFASACLPDGEGEKRLESMLPVFDTMLVNGFSRDCRIIALGGGVIGDLAGFVAATYQRGVDFVQVPTTLLAMVDSSVGGKTGVNHPRGKNMIGAFHQPRAVIADLAVLDTLPVRELRAGMAEVIKYALLGDHGFLEWLEAHIDAAMARDPEAMAFIIERCCRNKAAIVTADERESGQRALLNLGHTFGHAIEGARGYGDWLHGEAIAAGMCMAARMSTRLGWISPAQRDRAIDLIRRAGLPVRAPDDIGAARFREFMARDKKNRHGELRLVLLRDLGDATVTADYDPDALDATLESAGHE
ncbi:3-dehydroquinate synthase [Spiribacter vilamensis]|uniref:3-dehydroquinate synthase n=1 Tax=Spiribacter vilamensis TaxID=531306 RepID=A0A4Q8D1P7_9GAMM|nr:3-dehydroquinate synthase [Spiribacter vilamensis]RZU99268.1 3-dehydroquinate synthase [Spiribacter vilamensis]TVO61747.1 3-dehydroquinate synthase [Spiribacter vilamensis]